jgi:hypothetical protein
MPWAYRVMRQKFKVPMKDEYRDFYGIHEVYYDDTPDDPCSYTKDTIRADADSLEDLRWCLEEMLKALDKPILEYKDEDTKC